MRMKQVSHLLLSAVLPAQYAYMPADRAVAGIDLGHRRFRQSYSQAALVKITAMPPHNMEPFRGRARANTRQADEGAIRAIDAMRGECKWEFQRNAVTGSGDMSGMTVEDQRGGRRCLRPQELRDRRQAMHRDFRGQCAVRLRVERVDRRSGLKLLLW